MLLPKNKDRTTKIFLFFLNNGGWLTDWGKKWPLTEINSLILQVSADTGHLEVFSLHTRCQLRRGALCTLQSKMGGVL